PAVVLECTNLSPYRKAVQMAVGRPVFDIISLVSLFVSDIQGSD
ncbi:MAG: aspartate/glutamate racemase family protein, partial [Deltaproteobacteria bacterium]